MNLKEILSTITSCLLSTKVVVKEAIVNESNLIYNIVANHDKYYKHEVIAFYLENSNIIIII